jgi:hypothetical protein
MVLQTNSPQEATEMLTKTRTTIIALIAASSFAAASVVPAVSQAKPIDPNRGVTTKLALQKQVVKEMCSETLGSLNEDLQNLEKAHKEQNAKEIEKWRASANGDYQFGYEMGCGFAR